MTFEAVLGILLAGILSNNYALLHFLGTGAVIENERSSKHSLMLGLGTTVVMVLATLITWPIDKFLLEKVPFLQIIVFVIAVLVVVELIQFISKKLFDECCRSDFTKFAINGAVLGLCIHNTELEFFEAVITAVSVGIGFMLTMTVFAKLKTACIEEKAVPASFRGLPISLLTAGMIVLTLLALTF